jgi:hypothetical protein
MTRTGSGARVPLEDRVRDAIRAKAAEVPPDAVPPLRLPARRRSSFSLAHGGREREGGLARRPRAGRAWAAPIAAAAGVAAALAVVFALTGVIHSSRPANARPDGLDALPRYYVALSFTGGGRCCQPGQPYSPKTQAVVRATASGRALAVIRPPRPYTTFFGITAAGDDRTFVVAAQKAATYPVQLKATPETTFFVLRIDPASSNPAERARLIPIPNSAAPTGTRVWDLALSPDGTRLAVAAGVKVPHLSVVNVATGATRTWSPGGIGTNLANGVNQNSLSWAADNRSLALIYWGERGRSGIRVLDTAAPGSSLVSNSRLVVGQPATGDAYWLQARLTPDAHAIIANRDRSRRGFSQQLVEFSAGTGKAVRVLSESTHHLYGNDEQVLWMSPSGDTLIVTDAVPAHDHSRASFADVDAGMLVHGHYTPLPWSGNTSIAAW